jgi:iron only hydrogenase large subunit-like protein
MVALSRYLKSKDDKAVTVFIGPCTSKKREALETEDGAVDFVMTFEELQAIFNGKELEIAELEETPLDNASYFGRIFARIGGLTEAAAQAIKEQNLDFEVKPCVCDGIDNIKLALNKMKRGQADFNFLEGMACLGGCIGGPCNITHEIKDKMDVDKFGKTTKQNSITSSLNKLKK